jgi:hypothetical protein
MWHLLLHFLYWADHIRTERVGQRFVPVECARCGCQYFYQLVRMGFGSATAHYGLFHDRAEDAAERRAERNLARRLASEAELVPCPKCHWVNDELVTGFRRGQYGRLGSLASILVKVGVIFYLIVGGITVIFDPFVALCFGIVPLGLFAAAGVVHGVRFGLRSLIRPNRKHPLPPTLPPGSPPALFRDPATNDLILVPAEKSAANLNCCDFQVGRHTWPLICSVCVRPVTARVGYRLLVSSTKHLTLPLCRDCLVEVRRKLRRIWWNITLIGALVTAAVMVPLQLDFEPFCVISGLCLLIWWGIGYWVAKRAVAPVKIVGSDRSRGVVRLRFENADFARALNEYLNH